MSVARCSVAFMSPVLNCSLLLCRSWLVPPPMGRCTPCCCPVVARICCLRCLLECMFRAVAAARYPLVCVRGSPLFAVWFPWRGSEASTSTVSSRCSCLVVTTTRSRCVPTRARCRGVREPTWAAERGLHATAHECIVAILLCRVAGPAARSFASTCAVRPVCFSVLWTTNARN